MSFAANRPPHRDLVFFSPERWDRTSGRARHVATRFAEDHRCFYWEEPRYDAAWPSLELRARDGITVATPHLPPDPRDASPDLGELLDHLVDSVHLSEPIGWYWAPMMWPFSRHLAFRAVVWDCVDDALGPPGCRECERQLIAAAHVVFTSKDELYQAKRRIHPNVHPLVGERWSETVARMKALVAEAAETELSAG